MSQGESAPIEESVEDKKEKEKDFQAAIRNCGPYALKRLLRKMTKRKWRSNDDGTRRVLTEAKDLEEYVTRFILQYKDGPPRPDSYAARGKTVSENI